MAEIKKDFQTHRAVSNDGTEIAARVIGQGPSVLLLPAGPGDSELSWRHVCEFLSKDCTCHLLETRGRGHSSDNAEAVAGEMARFFTTTHAKVG